jgi:hypothetical protein
MPRVIMSGVWLWHVDQARHHDAALAVDRRGGRPAAAELIGGTDVDDRTVGDRDRAAAKSAIRGIERQEEIAGDHEVAGLRFVAHV